MITSSAVKETLKGAADVVFMDVYVNKDGRRPATLVYIEGLVSTEVINSNILKALTQEDIFAGMSEAEIIVQIRHGAVYSAGTKVMDVLDDVVGNILSGNAALIFDGVKSCVIFECRGFEKRGISEPSAENVIKGAKDSFIEVLRINTAMIRRKIKSSDLRLVEFPVGYNAAAQLAIVYMDGVADESLVADVLERLKSIDIDALKSTSCVEEQIVDRKYSIFPQTIYTERPDKLCANVLEGKIGILIDGYPIAYIVPAVFNMFFQSGEDYALNYFQGSMIRAMRYVCAFASLIIPAFYISITTFSQEMLPTNLMMAIINSKLSVPLSSFLEVVFMLIAFEILIESGVRLPKAIGQAISIVGGLVIGDAAVNANFVSPAVVVVIAVTAVCGFIIPSNDLANSFRLLRLLLVFFAGTSGLFGLSVGMLAVMYYMCTLTSFGAPYMEPYATVNGKMTLRDGFFRLPQKGGGK